MRVLMVGFGTIARTHSAVLRRFPDVSIVGAVDPVRASSDDPWFADLDTALGTDPSPDLVVVATPTGTHTSVASEVLARTSARVLSEKPFAATRDELDGFVRGDTGRARGRVQVAHHFAFSPEVTWARGFVADRPGWDRPQRVESIFNDAYGRRPDAELDSYGTSWIDSGPNQLSMLAAFVDGLEVQAHDEQRARSVTRLRHDGGTTWLATNWLAADSSKQTLLDFGEGNTVRMDHTAMTVVVTEAGAITHHVGYTGSLSRKEAHYDGLYRTLFDDPDDARLGLDLATRIVDVLEDAREAARPGSIGFVTHEE